MSVNFENRTKQKTDILREISPLRNILHLAAFQIFFSHYSKSIMMLLLQMRNTQHAFLWLQLNICNEEKNVSLFTLDSASHTLKSLEMCSCLGLYYLKFTL